MFFLSISFHLVYCNMLTKVKTTVVPFRTLERLKSGKQHEIYSVGDYLWRKVLGVEKENSCSDKQIMFKTNSLHDCEFENAIWRLTIKMNMYAERY